jgi:PAS domain-containing protein
MNLKNKPIIFKIVIPIVVVIILIGGVLYYFSLKAIKEFAEQHIRQDVLDSSQQIYSFCDKGLTELLYEGRADDEISLIIEKGLILDAIEGKARRENIAVLIYSDGKALLNVGSFDKTLLDKAKAGEISSVSIKDEKFYIYLFDFQPWNWQILIGRNYREYAGIVGKVENAYLIVFITLISAAFLLIWSLTSSIRNPLLSIVRQLDKGTAPDYKGTKEIEALSSSISNMMQTLNERVQELEKAEKEVRTAKEFTDVILNSINDVIYVADAESLKITAANSVFLKIYKTTKENVIGRHCYDLIH